MPHRKTKKKSHKILDNMEKKLCVSEERCDVIILGDYNAKKEDINNQNLSQKQTKKWNDPKRDLKETKPCKYKQE